MAPQIPSSGKLEVERDPAMTAALPSGWLAHGPLHPASRTGVGGWDGAVPRRRELPSRHLITVSLAEEGTMLGSSLASKVAWWCEWRRWSEWCEMAGESDSCKHDTTLAHLPSLFPHESSFRLHGPRRCFRGGRAKGVASRHGRQGSGSHPASHLCHFSRPDLSPTQTEGGPSKWRLVLPGTTAHLDAALLPPLLPCPGVAS